MVQSILMVTMILQKYILGYIIQRIFKTDPQKTCTSYGSHISTVKINKINMYFYLLHPFLWMWLLSLVCSTNHRITPTVCYCHWWIYIYSGRERKMTENFYFKEDRLHRMLCIHTPVPSSEPPLSSRFYWNTLLSSNIIYYGLFTSCH